MTTNPKTEELKNIFLNVTNSDGIITEKQKNHNGKFIGDEKDVRPTTTEICPECNNDSAFYELKQIRSADESETRFFTCTECGKNWREDDH